MYKKYHKKKVKNKLPEEIIHLKYNDLIISFSIPSGKLVGLYDDLEKEIS